jgi:TonB-dependent starch-binding outer membrane protein SusC
VAYMRGPEQFQNDSRMLGNVFAIVKPTKDITFKSSFGADLNTHHWSYYLDPFRTNNGRNLNGQGINDKSTTLAWLSENTLTYAKSNDVHDFNFLIGNSVQKSTFNDSYLQGNDFPDDTSVKTLNAANTITGSTRTEQWAIASFFSRATYGYKGRYLVTASLRRDGSSKLANHWSTFPSASVAWRISDESFLKGNDAITDLKVRLGWGINGNQEGIPNYARYGLINYNRTNTQNPLSGPASYQATYGNPDLKWESTNQSNVGVDLLMYNGRISFSADAYLKKTKDLLLNVQLSNSLPISTIQTNAGNIENKGIEFSLATVNTTTSPVKWKTDFNMSFNKNLVTDLKYTDVYYFGRIYSNNQDVTILKKGLSLGTFFGYVSEGVDPETGDLKYKDVNANGIFDPGDRTIIGNAQPDFTFGLTNDFQCKNFDLNIFIQGSYGNDIFNATRIDLEGMFDSKNQSVAVLNRWTPSNRVTDIPRAIGGGNVKNVYNSTRFIEDGSYARIKSLTLGYNFTLKALDKAKIRTLRLYATAQNLFTLTNYSGFDPEVNAFGLSATELGIDYGTYPQSKTIIVGVNVDF